MTPQFHFGFQKAENLLRIFEEIHNYIYANDGLSPQQTLEEMIKLLFVKIADENRQSKFFAISADELSRIEKDNQAERFVSRIRELFEQAKAEFGEVFDADERIKLSLHALGFVVHRLQTIALTQSSGDAKGLAFQKFLASRDKEGRGQFFTPEPIIDLCVEMIQPQPDEKIIDPACGSGGFLFSALRYLQKNFPGADASKIISQNLFGLDINKSIAKIAKMKLLLEANGQVNIYWANSLETSAERLISLLKSSHEEDFPDEGFDIILTNPPFGTVGKITTRSILSQYDLAHKWASKGDRFYKTNDLLNGQVTEILFIERSLSLLREGGRMAIVLPNGHFENPSLEYIRHFIKQKAKVLAIVKLPQETFIPYGTGVKTSLLFLQKDSANLGTPYQVFFGRVTKLGYQGNKNATPLYQKDQYGNPQRDESGELIANEDYSLLAENYRKFQGQQFSGAENSFAISFNELNGRFDYDFYAPENRRLLDILKRKDAVPLGELVEIVKAKSRKLSRRLESVEYVELSDINTHGFEIINSTTYAVYELPSRASYELRTGDIITAVAGNSVGTTKHATAFVTEEFNGCICTNGFRVLRGFKIDPYYLLYFFKSEYFLNQMFMYRTGAAIPNLADTDLANLLIYIPDPSTMTSISRRMKRSFELRSQSRRAVEDIELPIV
jgi:type I restriction enzyme M protein